MVDIEMLKRIIDADYKATLEILDSDIDETEKIKKARQKMSRTYVQLNNAVNGRPVSETPKKRGRPKGSARAVAVPAPVEIAQVEDHEDEMAAV